MELGISAFKIVLQVTHILSVELFIPFPYDFLTSLSISDVDESESIPQLLIWYIRASIVKVARAATRVVPSAPNALSAVFGETILCL